MSVTHDRENVTISIYDNGETIKNYWRASA